jgi:hypothetical protein
MRADRSRDEHLRRLSPKTTHGVIE